MLNYIDKGKEYLGINRYKDTEVLNSFWHSLRLGGYKNKPEIPWCSAFVGHCLKESGFDINVGSPYCKENSQYWLSFGEPVKEPYYGSIAVFKYNKGGHVGFVVGMNPNGNPIILGGNQNDVVSECCFNKKSIVGYRHPVGVDKIPLTIANQEIAFVKTV